MTRRVVSGISQVSVRHLLFVRGKLSVKARQFHIVRGQSQVPSSMPLTTRRWPHIDFFFTLLSYQLLCVKHVFHYIYISVKYTALSSSTYNTKHVRVLLFRLIQRRARAASSIRNFSSRRCTIWRVLAAVASVRRTMIRRFT